MLIADLIDSSGDISAKLSLSTVRKFKDASRLVGNLIFASEVLCHPEVQEAFGWSCEKSVDLKSKLDCYLSAMQSDIEKGLQAELNSCVPNIKACRKDRNLYYDAWMTTNNLFWEKFELAKLFRPHFGKCLQDNLISTPFDVGKSHYFSSRSDSVVVKQSFGGEEVAVSLTDEIVSILAEVASGSVEAIEPDDVLLIPYEDLRNDFFQYLSESFKVNVPRDLVVPISSGDALVVKPGAVTLVLHEWKGMPWSEGAANRIVVYGYADFKGHVEGVMSLYYRLEIHDPSKIAVLPKPLLAC
ncbi:hypothetical protein NBRC116587_37340 [Pseudoteredinibacter isoporae]